MMMKTKPCPSPGSKRNPSGSAFTFTDLLAALAALAVLGALVLPALAQGKPRSQQAICFNNLRAIGQAVMLFNVEHNQLDPWRELASSGGTRNQGGLNNNVWFQFAWLSNGLANPKVLACPSDALARPAKDYSRAPDGGLLSQNHQNNAISYFIGLDSSALVPDSVLAGDRNLYPNGGLGSGCSSGVSPVAAHSVSGGSPIKWGSALHGPSGNILFHDGRVEQTSNETVNRLFKLGTDDYGSFHFQVPRPPSP